MQPILDLSAKVSQSGLAAFRRTLHVAILVTMRRQITLLTHAEYYTFVVCMNVGVPFRPVMMSK